MLKSKFITRFQAAYPFVKRAMDILVSVVLLILLSPIFLIVAIMVKATSEGPVLFLSARTGYKGKTFMMPKFRTMMNGSKLLSREVATENDIRMTPVGNLLRKASLDEIPQLWSVLKGDMSLIGPRPLLENDQAADDRRKRAEIYDVKPGITGLAQVNGRNFISKRNKVRYDAFYATRLCIFLDLKIAYRTIGTVFNTKLVK